MNEICSVCNWTNTASSLLNLGDPGKPRWLCHGCIKREVAKLESQVGQLEKARLQDLSELRETTKMMEAAYKERDEAVKKHTAISDWLNSDSRTQYLKLSESNRLLELARKRLIEWDITGDLERLETQLAAQVEANQLVTCERDRLAGELKGLGRPCDTCGGRFPDTPVDAECPHCYQKQLTQLAEIAARQNEYCRKALLARIPIEEENDLRRQVQFWKDACSRESQIWIDKIREYEIDRKDTGEAWEQLANGFPAIQVDCITQVQAAQYILDIYEYQLATGLDIRLKFDAMLLILMKLLPKLKPKIRRDIEKKLRVLSRKIPA